MSKKRVLRESSMPRYYVKVADIMEKRYGARGILVADQMRDLWNREFGIYNKAWVHFKTLYEAQLKKSLLPFVRSCLLAMIKEYEKAGQAGIDAVKIKFREYGLPDDVLALIEDFVKRAEWRAA